MEFPPKHHAHVCDRSEPRGISDAFDRQVGGTEHEFGAGQPTGGQLFQYRACMTLRKMPLHRASCYAELPGDAVRRNIAMAVIPDNVQGSVHKGIRI